MKDIKRIVAPIDFSDNTETVVSAAACIAGKFSAYLDLIFVVQKFEDYTSFFTPPANLPAMRDDLLNAAKERMNAFVEAHKEEFKALGISTVNGQVISGDIAEAIVNYAEWANAQLIIMGTHGYKGFNRIVFGSVAEKVVKTACCPVMTVNPYREECEKNSE
ncbi:universal stress protein [Desulfobacter hydrogenophilus]|uniref:Universal stress protein n=1 Tax=Desulfobacter hydrogenophilus TaxID=2291 RepID=A0A328FKA8_9BACT|nr:universal stress protein [Desulfobacter hydrogenophilus]NDY70562.1 universal stress protein [Desulfobacter hydrogenophilus]QBH13933.1 universal stress protein [Desulfobacter hydrogenophilus]RAM03653.1 universal stress protein [Desulfobacter hydrogenophilus]